MNELTTWDLNPEPTDYGPCSCEDGHEGPFERCYCSCHGDPNSNRFDTVADLLTIWATSGALQR